MNYRDYFDRIPEYYPTMYMDGYTPTEILHATHKLMNRQFAEQEKTGTDEKERNRCPRQTVAQQVADDRTTGRKRRNVNRDNQQCANIFDKVHAVQRSCGTSIRAQRFCFCCHAIASL